VIRNKIEHIVYLFNTNATNNTYTPHLLTFNETAYISYTCWIYQHFKP